MTASQSLISVTRQTLNCTSDLPIPFKLRRSGVICYASFGLVSMGQAVEDAEDKWCPPPILNLNIAGELEALNLIRLKEN